MDIQEQTVAPVEIVIIIDRSGSMGMIRDDAIGALNTFIEDQKQQEGSANFTTVLFDNLIETSQNRVDLNEAVTFNTSNYVPRGGTALLDAIGTTIARFKELKPTNGLICSILTDGQENSSNEYRSASQIKDLITECEKELGWSFNFLAAGQDAFATGASFGISSANTQAFAATGDGVRSVVAKMSDYSTFYRSNRSAPISKPDDTSAPLIADQ